MEFKSLSARPKRYQIILCGDTKTGKTCLIKRYFEKCFVPKYLPTIGVDYEHLTFTFNDTSYLLNMFDFSGDAMFYEVRKEFYASTQGGLLVFDTTNRKSFDNLDWWLAEMYQEMGISNYHKASIIVCANKIDLRKREVSTYEGRDWAANLGLIYLETSVCTNTGVDILFEKLFQNMTKVDDLGKEDKLSHYPLFCPTPCRNIGQTSSTNTNRREVIQRLVHGRDDFEKMGLQKGATVEDVSRTYRHLAVLLHPDKNTEPGAEEIFKHLTSIRLALLTRLRPH